MLYLVAALFAVSVALFVIAVGSLIPGRPRAIERRLAEVAAGAAAGASAAPQQQRRRRPRRERITALLQGMGERIPRKPDTEETRQFLIRAGYRHPAAPSLYWGARVALGIGMALVVLILLAVAGAQPAAMVVGPIWLGAAGWVLPAFAVRRRMLSRQKELLHALPDALDMMVICMEAGLGLNQALLRVSEEIVHVSRVMSEELALVNLEIRAGAPRETALRNLGERTGVQDIRSLVAMLIQTDRFGTSVAQALRVQADTLRQKRRQRAEETAAKTTIKLVFPLVLFILPAMFVVILGPSLIQIMRTLSSFR